MTQKPIVVSEGKLCDYINGKFRKKCLVNEHKYEKERIAVKFAIRIDSRKPCRPLSEICYGVIL